MALKFCWILPFRCPALKPVTRPEFDVVEARINAIGSTKVPEELIRST